MRHSDVAKVCSAVFVAADTGAREALRPVAMHCGRALADLASGAVTTETHWAHAFAGAAPSMLVVGTSDGARGHAIETAARRAARATCIPIVAIEDFPGNYVDVLGGEAGLVLVESPLARDICRQKLAGREAAVAVVPPARYDAYRLRLPRLRDDTKARRDADAVPRALWAGQPDTDDCTLTLAAVLPALAALGVELLFKAHPRDPGYASGAYVRQIDAAGVRWSDVTGASVPEAFALAPRVVLTQFSSVAIEGGFFGIPSLWVLLPDAGQARLCSKKGYSVPPVCAVGGAALVTDARKVKNAVEHALTDAHFQCEWIPAFDAYFDVGQAALRATLDALQNALAGK